MTVERTVTVDTSGRLDKRLASELDESRSRLQRLIESGDVRVDGTVVTKKSRTVTPGQQITVNLETLEDRDAPPEPEAGPLTVLHEDPHLLAVEKPSGMVIHPNAQTQSGTLVNRILEHYPEQASLDRAGLVHRLDKGTSGIVLVGRTKNAMQELKRQFRERSVNKKYRAVLGGHLEDDSIKVDVPIARDPKNPMLRTAAADGKKAVTEFTVVNRAEGRSAVYCHPITGRTHQIRVHCHYLNAPVLGDDKYNGPAAERLILHAETIEFNHPEFAEALTLKSDIPEEVHKQWHEISPSSS